MEDLFQEQDELPTEVESDDCVIPGQKWATSGSLPNPQQFILFTLVYIYDSLCLFRTLKHTKGYSTLEDVQPTLRNKPSGLKPDWRCTASKPPTPRQQVPIVHAQSSSSSMLTSPTVSHLSLLDDDHTSSLLAISPPPIFGTASLSPSYGKLVPLIDKEAAGRQGHLHLIAVCFSLLLPHINWD